MSERIGAPLTDATLKPLAQEANDLCPSPVLTCTYTSVDPQRYPTVTGGEGTVTIVAQAPISNAACDAIGAMQPGFDVSGCKVVLDMTDQASSWTPQSLYLGIHGSVLDIGGGTQPDNFLLQANSYVGAQEAAGAAPVTGGDTNQNVQGVEITPSGPNSGQTPATVASSIDLGCWGSIATVVLALGVVGAIKIAEARGRRRASEPHPDRDLDNLDQRDFRSHHLPHSRAAVEATTDEEAYRQSMDRGTRIILEDWSILPIPADRGPIFSRREHVRDTESVNTLTDIRVNQATDSQYAGFMQYLYSKLYNISDQHEIKVSRWRRKNGRDGMRPIDPRKIYPYHLPGGSKIKQWWEDYVSSLPGNKK